MALSAKTFNINGVSHRLWDSKNSNRSLCSFVDGAIVYGNLASLDTTPAVATGDLMVLDKYYDDTDPPPRNLSVFEMPAPTVLKSFIQYTI